MRIYDIRWDKVIVKMGPSQIKKRKEAQGEEIRILWDATVHIDPWSKGLRIVGASNRKAVHGTPTRAGKEFLFGDPELLHFDSRKVIFKGFWWCSTIHLKEPEKNTGDYDDKGPVEVVCYFHYDPANEFFPADMYPEDVIL